MMNRAQLEGSQFVTAKRVLQKMEPSKSRKTYFQPKFKIFMAILALLSLPKCYIFTGFRFQPYFSESQQKSFNWL